MNNVLKAIKERYSCRDFTGEALKEDQVKALVDAALAAPSAMNRQPWHLIVVTNKDLVDQLDAEGMKILSQAEDKSGYERMMARGGKLFYNAPCMIIITAENPQGAALDCGILVENLALAAHSLGLGNVIVGMAGVPLSGPNGDEFKKRLQFPPGHGFSMGILVGAAKEAKAPHELDYNKVSYIK